MADQVSLDGLSVEELERLQTRVSEALTARFCEKVDFTEFDFSPCDDRSMGSVKFAARTRHGLLEYSANLGNGYTDDVRVLLDGERRDGVSDCLDVPDFHDNTSGDEAKRECARAVLSFEAAYGELTA